MHYIEELQAAILKLHGCTATYLETVAVTETFQGETIWQGEVEVFEIEGHPKAKRAYAWGHVAGESVRAIISRSRNSGIRKNAECLERRAR